MVNQAVNRVRYVRVSGREPVWVACLVLQERERMILSFPLQVFFHRQASNYETLRCKNGNDQCVIDKRSRRSCSKCRLRKCFEAAEMKMRSSPSSNGDSENKINILSQSKALVRTTAASTTIPKPLAPPVQSLTANDLELISHARASMKAAYGNEWTARVVEKPENINRMFWNDIPLVYLNKSIAYCQRMCHKSFDQLNKREQLTILKRCSFNVQGIRNIMLYDIERDRMPMFVAEDEIVWYDKRCSEELRVLNQLQDRFAKQEQENMKFFLAFWQEMQNDNIIRDLVSR